MAVDVGVGWRLADGAGVETVVLRASIEDVQSLRLWGGVWQFQCMYAQSCSLLDTYFSIIFCSSEFIS
jgi:hypothetical protein